MQVPLRERHLDARSRQGVLDADRKGTADDRQGIGLFQVAGDLGEELVLRDADRDDEPGLGVHRGADLLSDLDRGPEGYFAAIGGKTAVNVDGKNLAGVFAHPRSVVIDADTIDDLPSIQKVHGAAEAIKTGFLGDMRIVEAYESSPGDVDLELIVNLSASVKVAVVNEDFTEQGARAILNYGHTIGHAVETVSGMSHGEAVAIGMIAAGAASEAALGFNGNDRQRTILAEVGLPTRAPEDLKADQVRAVVALDKKRDATGLRFVLLKRFEDPVVVTADDATVRAAFEGIGLLA